jgi:hypothetical protein
MGGWYGAAGGESYFKKEHGSWRLLTSGGGAYDAADLVRYGVPRDAACHLVQVRTGCTR